MRLPMSILDLANVGNYVDTIGLRDNERTSGDKFGKHIYRTSLRDCPNPIRKWARRPAEGIYTDWYQPCNCWLCDGCGPIKQESMRQIAQAGIDLGPTILLSLDIPHDGTREQVWSSLMRKRDTLHQRLRRWAARERGQKGRLILPYLWAGHIGDESGYPDVHVLYRDLYVPAAVLSPMAAAVGLGAHVRGVDQGTASYITRQACSPAIPSGKQRFRHGGEWLALADAPEADPDLPPSILMWEGWEVEPWPFRGFEPEQRGYRYVPLVA
jgi:hypothetical protein